MGTKELSATAFLIAWRRFSELYPSNRILEFIRKLDIPITLCSDAHDPNDVVGYFNEACNLLKGMGFTLQRVFTANGWVDEPLG